MFFAFSYVALNDFCMTLFSIFDFYILRNCERACKTLIEYSMRKYLVPFTNDEAVLNMIFFSHVETINKTKIYETVHAERVQMSNNVPIVLNIKINRAM